MDRDGVDAELVNGPYEQISQIRDPELRAACVRAVNDWARELYEESNGRFIMLLPLPCQGPEEAVAELLRVAEFRHTLCHPDEHQAAVLPLQVHRQGADVQSEYPPIPAGANAPVAPKRERAADHGMSGHGHLHGRRENAHAHVGLRRGRGCDERGLGKIHFSRDQLHAEIQEMVAGTKTGRERDDERILIHTTGLVSQDVALAHFMYRRALEQGRGVWLPSAAM